MWINSSSQVTLFCIDQYLTILVIKEDYIKADILIPQSHQQDLHTGMAFNLVAESEHMVGSGNEFVQLSASPKYN